MLMPAAKRVAISALLFTLLPLGLAAAAPGARGGGVGGHVGGGGGAHFGGGAGRPSFSPGANFSQGTGARPQFAPQRSFQPAPSVGRPAFAPQVGGAVGRPQFGTRNSLGRVTGTPRAVSNGTIAAPLLLRNAPRFASPGQRLGRDGFRRNRVARGLGLYPYGYGGGLYPYQTGAFGYTLYPYQDEGGVSWITEYTVSPCAPLLVRYNETKQTKWRQRYLACLAGDYDQLDYL